MVPATERAANVDLQLTEVCPAVTSGWKLHDEISVRRQAAGTLQVKHLMIQVLSSCVVS